MAELFCSVFVLIFLAELPDKTALATLVMATRNHPLGVFIGACSAFVVQSAIAVLAGSLLTLLPPLWVHRAAGAMFLVFAVMMWRKKDEDGEESAAAGASSWLKATGASFMVVFVAEWGDLTQLATAALVARYGQPLLVFFAATLALWSVTGIGVLAGHHLKRFVNPQRLERFAAILFAVVGVFIIASSGG